MGCQRGFVRSGGVQGRSEGFIGGHWRSGELIDVRVGQERSGKCRRVQGVQGIQGSQGMSGEVMESMGGQGSFENISLL